MNSFHLQEFNIIISFISFTGTGKEISVLLLHQYLLYNNTEKEANCECLVFCRAGEKVQDQRAADAAAADGAGRAAPERHAGAQQDPGPGEDLQ